MVCPRASSTELVVHVSGTISLVKPFPPGTNRMFQLQVQGTDKGGLVSEIPARVEISVYSGVVHLPAFTLTMYNFSVVEDVPEGALVGRIEATVDSSSSSSSSGSSGEGGGRCAVLL